MICNASPLGDTRGIELKLERPPTNPNTRWGPPVAWLVRLADKTTCEFVEGAPLSVTISGRLTFIHDSCGPWISNRSWHILDAYQTGRVWTARKVLVEYKPGIGAIVLKSFPIAITTAWL